MSEREEELNEAEAEGDTMKTPDAEEPMSRATVDHHAEEPLIDEVSDTAKTPDIEDTGEPH